ncbi:Alpha/beta hydrolase family protein [Lachnospiraceae bacterium A10]|nr:Alpha/beta hydrolase family protein [Lachnospiraceae bacterium A10]
MRKKNKSPYVTIKRRDNERAKRHQRESRRGFHGWKKFLAILLIVLVVLGLGGFAALNIYAADYYRADDTATAILDAQYNMDVQDDYIVLWGNEKAQDYDASQATIFYPGGKVEYTAYLPLLQRLQESGMTVVLVKMPYNLAFFGVNTADEIMAAYPEITTWNLAGHSLGGVAACMYYSSNSNKINRVALLGSYIYGDVNRDNVEVIYGTEDGLLDTSKILDTDNVVKILGGNHAQFGSYGEQDGDGDATLSSEYQQRVAATAMMLWFIDGEVYN